MNTFITTASATVLVTLGLARGAWAAEPVALPADAVPAQGLVVVVAPEDPELPVALAGPGRLVVVFVREGSAVRRSVRAKGVAGLVQVIELPALDVLPVADRLAALTVGGADVPPAAELTRVTRPLGCVARWQEGAWRVETVPWPAGMMQWPDGHGGPSAEPYRGRDVFLTWPMAPRWADGPAIGMVPVGYDSACLVSAGGRLVAATKLDDANLTWQPAGYGAGSWWLVARDAFSGMRLWRRPLGYDPMPVRMREISRKEPLRSLAMDETRVFTWGEKGLLVLDAATGNQIRQLDTVRPPAVIGRIFLAGGRVLAQIEGGWQAFDLKTLASVWDVAVDTKAAMADDRTLAVVGPERIIAVDVATGAVRWQCEHTRPAVDKPVAAVWSHTNVGIDYVDAEIVVAWLGSERWILGAVDGTKRWTLGRPGRNGSPAVVARHGDVIQIGSSVCRVADGQPVRDRVPQPVGGGNCTMPLLLENFAINGKGSVIRLPGNRTETYPAMRTPCNGYVPVANGLLYAVGSSCGCVPLFVRGVAAHGAARIVDTEALAGRPRPVERGPGQPAKEHTTGWTMYRADLQRSAATAAKIGGVPNIAWTARLDDPLPDGMVAQSRRACALHGPSAPTVAGDAICVVDRDRHSLVCLDAADGKVRWRKDLPAVVDTPPTLAGGRALFGAHDGWVYCLSLADGAVVWRARAAPADDWWMAYGRLASRWPVIGSVVVEGDTVLATAGWTVGRDGGIFAVAFGLADGATRWARVLSRPLQKVTSKVPCFNDVAIADARGVPVVVAQCLRAEPEESAAVLQVPQEGLVQSDLRTRGRFDLIFRGVRGLSLAFADDLVFCGDKHKIAAFAPDPQPGQPPRLGKLAIPGGPPHAVALAGDVVVAAQGQPDGTGKLIVCTRTDGSAVTSLPLPAPPVRDGLAVVEGAIVAVCADGSVVMTKSR